MPIQVGTWAALKEYLVPLRTVVFIEEQQVPVELEWDEEDASAHHLVAFDEQSQAIGCARVLPSGQIGRMAVLANARQRGWGTALLAVAEDAARNMGLTEVFLHAQTHAIPFYARYGYAIASDEFMDAGIPHRTMIKSFRNQQPA